MKKLWDEKLLKYILHALLFAGLIIMFYHIIANFAIIFKHFGEVLRWLQKVLAPFLVGCFIAYLLNPGVIWFEENLFQKIKSVQQKTKLIRLLSIVCVYLIVIISATVLIVIITPGLTRNISDIVINFPEYMKALIKFTNELEQKLTDHSLYFLLDDLNISKHIEEWTQKIIFYATNSYNKIFNIVFISITNATAALLNFIIGSIMAFYLLFDKNLIKRNSKKLLYALVKETKADKILDYAKKSNHLFKRYIVGRSVDSFIIGCICFIGLLLLDVPYALLFSIIVGLTNLIPYFGPFIGIIIVVGITLFSSINEALWVFLFLFALQQFDGLFLGPKILGDSVGIRPIWILVSIYVGGSLFGVLGMFLAVPIAAILLMIIGDLLDALIIKKGINAEKIK